MNLLEEPAKTAKESMMRDNDQKLTDARAEHADARRVGAPRNSALATAAKEEAELDHHREVDRPQEQLTRLTREAAEAEKRMDTLRKTRRRADQSSLHATVSKSWPHVWHQ